MAIGCVVVGEHRLHGDMAILTNCRTANCRLSIVIGASAASPYLVNPPSTLSVYIIYVCHGPARY